MSKNKELLKKKFDMYCEKKSSLPGNCAPEGSISCTKCESRWYIRTELLKEVNAIVDKLKQYCNVEMEKVIEVWKKANINFELNMEDSQYQNVIDYIDDTLKSKLKALEGE